MYGRDVEGETLNFGVSGSLIMNALVMYDRETDSLWSQFLGVGVRGPHTGTALEMLGSSLMTWEAWRELRPDTLVLDQGGRRRDPYDGYYTSGSAGVRGESNTDARLDTKEFVLGLQLDGAQKAYPFRYLRETPVINDSVGGRAVVIAFDQDAGGGRVFDRQVAGRVLTFDASARAAAGGPAVMVDRETGTAWLMLAGEALDGPLAGERLESLPVFASFWFAWSDFHPRSEFYTPP